MSGKTNISITDSTWVVFFSSDAGVSGGGGVGAVGGGNMIGGGAGAKDTWVVVTWPPGPYFLRVAFAPVEDTVWLDRTAAICAAEG